jgi:Protein of unknown function (DUF3830)
MRWIRMMVGDRVLLGTLEDERAPRTCAAFVRLLPLAAKLLQARWSGEAAWVPLGALDLAIGLENEVHRPRAGQVLLYPAGASETEILMPYGVTAFAAKNGPLMGNHFLTVTDGTEQVAEIGRCLLWQGARDIVFEMLGESLLAVLDAP